MINEEIAKQLLKDKEKVKFKAKDFKTFSAPYEYLGCLLTNTLPENNRRKSVLKKYQEFFGDDVLHNPWNTPEGEELAIKLYGKLRAPYITKMWEFTKTLPFQKGYYRKPFRIAPCSNHIELNLERLQNLCYTSTAGFSDCSFKEQAQLTGYYNYTSNAFLFAVVLEEGHAELLETIKDIILGEEEIGAVSGPIIKALLLTNNKNNWQVVVDLLLAAQRQEGLRQTILECLDETNLGALEYVVDCMVTNNLSRFSSVIRAIDTWFGFGWEAPKKATVKRILQLVLDFLPDASKIDDALKSKDNLEVYVALWAIGIRDVSVANTKAFELVYSDAPKEKKLLALYFIAETERTQHSLPAYMEKVWGADVELDYWMLKNVPSFDLKDNLFNKIKATAEALPNEGKQYGGQVFDWKVYKIGPDDFYRYLINHASESQLITISEELAKIPSDIREMFLRKIFPEHYTYSLSGRGYYGQKEPTQLELTPNSWKRKVLHQAITDRNMSVMATGMQGFRHMQLGSQELEILTGLLSRKGKELRTATIELLVQQPEDKLKTCTLNLIQSKKVDQRLGALEILTVLDDKAKYPKFVSEQITAYKQRPKFSKNEEVYLGRLGNNNDAEFTFANGFGVINYDALPPLLIPKSKFPERTKKDAKFRFNAFVDAQKLETEIYKLVAIYDEHKDYEYQAEGYQGEIETLLLGNRIKHLHDSHKGFTAEEILNDLPLADVWKKWYNQSGLNDFEMYFAVYFLNYYGNPLRYFGKLKKFAKTYFPKLAKLKIGKDTYYGKKRRIGAILSDLYNAYKDDATIISFKIDAFEDMIANCPEDYKNRNLSTNEYRNEDEYWTDYLSGSFALVPNEITFLKENNRAALERYFKLKNYLFAQGLGFPNKVKHFKEVTEKYNDHGNYPTDILTLYLADKLSENELVFYSLYDSGLLKTIDGGEIQTAKNLENIKLPQTQFKQLKANLLQVELQRGDLNTEASGYIGSFSQIKGVNYLLEVLQRMGKDTFERGYSYYQNSKKSNFSSIIRKSVPAETDTYEDFAKGIKAAKIPTKRLFEVACYATQWAEWIGRFLKIDDLEDAVWWFHAHASDYMNANKETIISRYSNISKNDFSNGAIDIEWFKKVYTALGKSNWKLLHDASKYITDGNGHRQVKLYSNVMLGEVKITETLKKVNDKRDKDYVRALGLIPLSKTVPEKDVLKRYNLLQTFLKESKQFGAQRQESEKIAVEIALDNLSRNAGFEDRIRFGWAMEGKATAEIMKNNTVVFDDVTVTLVVNEHGKANITVQKGDKAQKTIPAKYKKDKQIIALKEGKSYLTKQYSRTRKSLESTMLREDMFKMSEIEKILEHPVVRAMLTKLVLFNKETQQSGFYKEGGLVDAEGKFHQLSPDDSVVIAHPSHLFEAVQWDLYQKQLFQDKIVQPFKQVFRELYVITENEREHSFRSERYQGHQIQPKKTVALLRGRGWTVNHEEGLQKVFHQHGIMATMYAMADWYSPADVEAPTLEYVCFHSVKNYKPLPMVDVPPVIFSEIMRDVDLVVSVAHVGGVDPEASHSTMEMRAVLAKESARLFKLNNVEVKERHVLIKGKLGDYSIHLGSAIISKGGLQLNIIPVHSQHRGRIFLPFVDDDPKTAELISKMKLLAEDHKIQDPTVLAQLNK